MATTDTSEIYFTCANIAQKLQLDPSAPVRWMRRGVLLADGSRLVLQHVCTPGGYRVKPEWLDAFLKRIADDRAGKPDAAPKTSPNSPRVAAMRAGLEAVGLV